MTPDPDLLLVSATQTPRADGLVGVYAEQSRYFRDLSGTLLHRGNRTYVKLCRGPQASGQQARFLPQRWVEKGLLPFADVSPERTALHREAELQNQAMGAGVVPIFALASPDEAYVIGARGRAMDGHEPSEGEKVSQALAPRFYRAYVDAPTLKEYSDQKSLAPVALAVAQRLARTLSHLHQDQVDEASFRPPILHRDVTPNNLYITDSGDVWLSDFGLARYATDPPLQADEFLQGSPRFLPTELLRQIQPTEKSDVFQWGLLVAWMLGAKIFVKRPGESLAQFCARRDQEAGALLRIHAVDDALAEDPKSRPSTGELCARLSKSCGR